MNKLLKKIFRESNFKINDAELLLNSQNRSFFAINQDSDKKEYFLVVFFNTNIEKNLNNLVEKKSYEYYSNLKKIDKYEKEMGKNTSLIVCIKQDSLILDDNIKQAINKVEEDLYNFKKYVLVYTQQQKEFFQSNLTKLEDKKIELIDHLQEKLNNTEEFEKFKANPKKDTYYNLIIKLFIKFPFLNLKSLENSSLENLEKKIEKELKSIETFEFINSLLKKEGLKDLKNDKFLNEIGVIE